MIDLAERLTTYIGDCMAILPTLQAESVDCVVTSPPYWQLRDYGASGQLGLEATPDEHVAKMVKVFGEVKRILKKSGTCFVNYGDSYATGKNWGKKKDLCLIPQRFAIAMQNSGWWVRSEIIWAKPNPMPESVTDRPANAHEKIFLFTKASTYFYDAGVVRQKLAGSSVQRLSQDIEHQTGSSRANGGNKTNGNMKAVSGVYRVKRQRGQVPGNRVQAGLARLDQMSKAEQCANGRNLRDYEPAPLPVWNIATVPFTGEHFATFPPELAERCILAGCPKNGVVLDPFSGAGTTGLVALRHGRKAVLIEINKKFMEMARRRINAEWHMPDYSQRPDFGPLFKNIPEAAE
ncbi:site-specific DNA-methyltransferase [Bartonella apihabitans]|nr:site-specific DNA-methyltransferase [Bartonella apihabitans]WLT09625.1 site-specific DNA-methyltransferase [Bartonella apihabitans]